jgi:hypothetical protein
MVEAVLIPLVEKNTSVITTGTDESSGGKGKALAVVPWSRFLEHDFVIAWTLPAFRESATSHARMST